MTVARGRAAVGGVLVGVLTLAGPPAQAADGQVFTFGDDAVGQLGNGVGGPPPPAPPGGAGASRVAGGREHVLVLKAGDVWAWGGDSFGQVGNDAPYERVEAPVRVLTGARDVTTGHLHSLALLAGGGVRAWGSNSKGQSGPAAGEEPRAGRPVAVRLPGPASMVAAGRAHSMAVVGGRVYTWGDNKDGQLGLGSADGERHPTPARVTGLPAIRFVAGGRDTTYAIATNGDLYAWGSSSQGQLGNGGTGDVPRPVRVLGGVRQIEAGADHAVAVRTDGSVWTWGGNGHGQLGRGGGPALRPARVPGLAAVAKAYAGRDHVLALAGSGAVLAWGRNDGGQLGVPPSAGRSRPAAVPGVRGVRDAGGGERYSVVLD